MIVECVLAALVMLVGGKVLIDWNVDAREVARELARPQRSVAAGAAAAKMIAVAADQEQRSGAAELAAEGGGVDG